MISDDLSAIIGPAGSGKTWMLRERAANNPNYAKVCATTGVAAINMGAGVTTVNSVLGFYNEESAQDALDSGRMAKRFVALSGQGYDWLVIDEISMMPAQVLDIIVQARDEALPKIDANKDNPTGILVLGDWLQLPPVNGKFAFTGQAWPRTFEKNLTKLTTIYRQQNAQFVAALAHTRAGRGVTAALELRKCEIEFCADRDDFFDGVIIVPTNSIANKINETRYDAIDAEPFGWKSARWGHEASEWREIPETLTLKKGAAVVVLANEPQTFEYVNGDRGILVDTNEHYATVRIMRDGRDAYEKAIPFIMRVTVQRMKPEGVAEYIGFMIDGRYWKSPAEIEQYFADVDCPLPEVLREATRRRIQAQFFSAHSSYVDEAVKARQPYFSFAEGKWVVGWIEYMPLRLGYASTIHRTQGLTLDKIQIDARSRFAGGPAMMYVALSRCRTPENIRIVTPGAGDFSRRIQAATECLRWI